MTRESGGKEGVIEGGRDRGEKWREEAKEGGREPGWEKGGEASRDGWIEGERKGAAVRAARGSATWSDERAHEHRTECHTATTEAPRHGLCTVARLTFPPHSHLSHLPCARCRGTHLHAFRVACLCARAPGQDLASDMSVNHQDMLRAMACAC